MHEILIGLLSDKKGGEVFSCFGVWHILYMAVIFGAIALAVLLLKKKGGNAGVKAVGITISAAFGLYIADFFMMPLAYGEIDIEKLPFHACTAMCVICFLSRHNKFLWRFKQQFALLGLVSNLIYVIYPAGVGWYMIHPLSYRVIQTLLFHGLMTAYGIFVLVFDDVHLEWRRCYRDLALICVMALWAMLGNAVYNGVCGEKERLFNWFFVVRDPFYALPENIAPYIMPFVAVTAMFAGVMLVYLVYFAVKSLFGRR